MKYLKLNKYFVITLHIHAQLGSFERVVYLAEDVQGGTVVVKVNYRTGVLGFLNGGNYGLDDARKSFEWIKSNIKSFGGDETKITLMGDGFGAVVSAALSTIYPTEVSNVILQSGSFSSPWGYNENPEATTNCVLKNTGMNGVEELKSADLFKILSSTKSCPEFPFGLFNDGEILPQHPSKYRVFFC